MISKRKPVTHEYLKQSRKTRPIVGKVLLEKLKQLKTSIKERAYKAAKETHPQNRITCQKIRRPKHPFARRPKIINNKEEANYIIENTVIHDIDGGKLNAPLLMNRLPVIVMQTPPLPPTKLRKLNKKYFGKIGWREAYNDLGWCMVHDSVLVVYWDANANNYVFHCLALSHRQFPEVATAETNSCKCIASILSGLDFVIGKSRTSIRDGVKLRGGQGSPGKAGFQEGQKVKGEMAMEGWVLAPTIAPKNGYEQSYAYYALKKHTNPDSIMRDCARHAVALNTLEGLHCPSANRARREETKHLRGIYPGLADLAPGTGFTGTAGYACELHLDSSTRGTFETIWFGPPPQLPKDHKWIFALADAGVLINLQHSPTFLMIPGQDVLHGTMYTGHASGRDHVEHKAGGSALMNKRKLTNSRSRTYKRLHLAREHRIVN